MKIRKALLVLAMGASALVGGVAFAGGNSTMVCQTIGTVTPVTIATPNVTRVSYSIWTTSGAPTVYFNDDGNTPAWPVDSHSGALVGGASYTNDNPRAVWAGNIKALAHTGNAWLCFKEGW